MNNYLENIMNRDRMAYKFNGGLICSRSEFFNNSSAKVLVDQTSAAQANFVFVIERISEFTLVVIVTMCIRAVNSSNVNDNIGLRYHLWIARSYDRCILKLWQLL